MRFISKTPQYRITAIKPVERSVVGADGRVHRHTEDPGFIAQFMPHGLTAWEMDKAREKWAKDWANKIPRGGRIENKFGVFDTAMHQQRYPDQIPSDERRVEIEEALQARASHGLRFERVDKPKIPIPWPTYDEIVTAQGVTLQKVASKIVDVATDIGANVDMVIAYERENLNRQQVIDALMAAGQSEELTESAVRVSA